MKKKGPESLFSKENYWIQAESFLHDVKNYTPKPGVNVDAYDLRSDLLGFLPHAAEDFEERGLTDEAQEMRDADQELDKPTGERTINVTITGADMEKRFQTMADLYGLAGKYSTLKEKTYMSNQNTVYPAFTFGQ